MIKEEFNEELVYGIPKVESFILPKDQDSLFETMMERKTKADYSISLDTCTKSSKRIKRWLKDEDRKLIHIILELKNKNNISESQFKGDLSSNEENKKLWTFIKNSLHTSRSMEFLQSRYYKLLSNQKLNTKEKMLLSDEYDSMSIDQLMVKIPGKTKETLSKLVSELKAKDEMSRKTTEIIDHQIEAKKDLKI